jgi:hypothetical protein
MMRRQNWRRWAEHVGHGQEQDPTACHSTGALSRKRRLPGWRPDTNRTIFAEQQCGRRHQALTLRWWTETSSEFVVGRHGATGNTSKLVATDRQRQRGSSMAVRKSPCPDIAAQTWQHWASRPTDLLVLASGCPFWGLASGGAFGRARSHHRCSRFTMHIVHSMRPPCPHDDPTANGAPLGVARQELAQPGRRRLWGLCQ